VRGTDNTQYIPKKYITGPPPRAGDRHSAPGGRCNLLRITPACGGQTLVRNLLIFHRTCLCEFATKKSRLSRLKPQHSTAVGALATNAFTDGLIELDWIVNAQVTFDDSLRHGLARD
jgi:hypothetical protein